MESAPSKRGHRGRSATTHSNDEFFRRLFESSVDGILQTTADGKTLMANDAACALLGRTEAQLQRIGWAGVLDDRHPHGAAMFNERRERGKFRREVHLVRADGTGFPCEVSSTTYVDADGQPRAIVTLRDVTDRVTAERILRDSEQRLRAVIEACPVPFALNDETGNIVYVNPAFTGAFGYTAQDIPTLDRWWSLAYPDPAYRQWVANTWRARRETAQRTREPFDPMEVVIRDKAGGVRTAIAHAVTLPETSAGTHLVVLLDITEQRTLERGLLDAAGREQQRLAIALHDGLGQQLTGLSLMLSGLARSRRDLAPELVHKELAALARLAGDCVATTRLLAHGLAPIELGSGGLERALRRLAKSKARMGGLDVVVRLRGFKGKTIDRSITEPVYRIVQEALTNAAKHSGASQVLVDAGIESETLTIAITDNGRGLPAQTTDGLGLSIMRYRARALGGRVDVENLKSGGTTIRCVCQIG